MPKFPNKIARNIPSPKNEPELKRAYIKLNPKAEKSDKLDIAMVKTKDGVTGVGLMNPKFNRGRDKEMHIVKNFISKSNLNKAK